MLVTSYQIFSNGFDFIEKVDITQASGEGIKRTPIYETPLSREDLDKWRKEFWGKSIYKEDKLSFVFVETRTQGH